MKIIVTGGAGFIGSAMVWALNKMGLEDILIVDNLASNPEKWKNLVGLRYLDYIEKDDFLEHIEKGTFEDCKFRILIHLGACSSTTETDCSYLVHNNFEYSKTLAIWAKENKVRFIYASSAATYGDGEQGFEDDLGEIEHLRPLNMYGYSKQMFDLWMRKSGLLNSAVGLKFFNVFGPNEYHKGSMRSFILKSFEQINEKKEVCLFKSYNPDYKDGEQLRDFIYVKDVVKMIAHFMDKHTSGLFNIATGQARSWNDLVTATFNAMNIEPNIKYIEMPDSIKNQYQYYTKGDITKLLASGYNKPIMTLEESIDDYVKNYLIPGKRL
ncbi:MAG: ADP-glyceromanno-heptose 6-epimerase [Candidatus Riflebacteria bacterium]|nr:ADP-glyceromanno-heptose 6-epimerase [Candidatus Riflebacteria bacterium]